MEILGWPADIFSNAGSQPSGPNKTGVYGALASNPFYSASVVFSVTASSIYGPGVAYATCSIMFCSESWNQLCSP